MRKNIVICSDGTGNTAIKGRGTNVFKLYEALDTCPSRDPDRPLQVAFYDDGVGTEDLKWVRLATGATGWGLSRNVKQLYVELARVYVPGDRIFLFGFSRGAFTVRTLAGFIAFAGLLDASKPHLCTRRALEAAARTAYKEYRRRYQTWLSKQMWKALTAAGFHRRSADPAAFRAENCVACEPEIEFLGVWDTVDAVGLPFQLSDLINQVVRRFKFPDRELNHAVKHACHALALDEARASFAPVLWDERSSYDNERIEQVWFAGVHSNVGGGYPRQGMSIVSLDWMMTKAAEHGLRFTDDDRRWYREHATCDDKMYDSRSGFGVFYRWRLRDVAALCERHGISPPQVHVSVFERIARGTEGYAPLNIPRGTEPVMTPGAGLDLDRISSLMEDLHEPPPSLKVARPWIGVGLASYYAMLMTLGVLAWEWVEHATPADPAASLLARIAGAFKPLGQVLLGGVGGLDPSFLHNLTDRGLITVLVVGAAVSWGLGRLVDRELDILFGSFWRRHQGTIREAIGFTAPSPRTPGGACTDDVMT